MILSWNTTRPDNVKAAKYTNEPRVVTRGGDRGGDRRQHETDTHKLHDFAR